MLEMIKTATDNIVTITGTLNEMDFRKGTTKTGSDYIGGTMKIAVDQEISGKMTENIIPVDLFATRTKKDGTPNKLYDIISSYADNFISKAAAEDEKEATRVTVSSGKLIENIFIKDGKEISSARVSTNFVNKAKPNDKEGATFVLDGCVLLGTQEEIKNEELTGRLIVKVGIVTYNGQLDVIQLIATGNAKTHIEQNWAEGDTVKVSGKLNISSKTETYVEEQGFGEPIERVRTVSCRELVVTGGSSSGYPEDSSYDADSIKKACLERRSRIEAKKTEQPKAKPKTKVETDNFDW